MPNAKNTDGKLGGVGILELSRNVDNLQSLRESVARELVKIGNFKLGKNARQSQDKATRKIDEMIAALEALQSAFNAEIDAHLADMPQTENGR